MQIHVDKQVEVMPELAIGLKETMKLLETEIAPSRFGPEVTAEVTVPNGSAAIGAAVEVKLSDSYGTFSRSFTQKEFNDYNRLVGGLRHIWMNLLGVRVSTHLKRADELAAQIAANEEED